MNKFMEVASSLARDNISTKIGGPFGAVIVKNNEIIGKGSNHVIGNNDPTAHAEIMAIRDACSNINSYDLSGCDIYTTSFPCPMCLSAIIWSNIKNVYYGNTKEDADNIGFRDDFIYNYLENKQYNSNNELLNFNCIDREETIKLFEQYSENKDSVIY